MLSILLTDLSEGGDKDPEGDDEGDLHPLELDVEDMVLRGVSMTVSVVRAIMTKLLALDRVLIKHFLMTTKLIIFKCELYTGRKQSVFALVSGMFGSQGFSLK